MLFNMAVTITAQSYVTILYSYVANLISLTIAVHDAYTQLIYIASYVAI